VRPDRRTGEQCALTCRAERRRIRGIHFRSKEHMTKGSTRREFLGSMAALTMFPLEQEKPELILHNGNIWTVNAAEPRAQAVAISRGRFLAVGGNSDVLNLALPGVQKIDLGGKTVLPGFIDAHSHPSEAGRLHLRMVDCDLPLHPGDSRGAARTVCEDASRGMGAWI
jgi:hypothetical protein